MGETLVDKNIRLLRERLDKIESVITDDIVERLNNVKPQEKVDLTPINSKIRTIENQLAETNKRITELIERTKEHTNNRANDLLMKIDDLKKIMNEKFAFYDNMLEELFNHPSIKVIEEDTDTQ